MSVCNIQSIATGNKVSEPTSPFQNTEGGSAFRKPRRVLGGVHSLPRTERRTRSHRVPGRRSRGVGCAWASRQEPEIVRWSPPGQTSKIGSWLWLHIMWPVDDRECLPPRSFPRGGLKLRPDASVENHTAKQRPCLRRDPCHITTVRRPVPRPRGWRAAWLQGTALASSGSGQMLTGAGPGAGRGCELPRGRLPAPQTPSQPCPHAGEEITHRKGLVFSSSEELSGVSQKNKQLTTHTGRG